MFAKKICFIKGIFFLTRWNGRPGYHFSCGHARCETRSGRRPGTGGRVGRHAVRRRRCSLLTASRRPLSLRPGYDDGEHVVRVVSVQWMRRLASDGGSGRRPTVSGWRHGRRWYGDDFEVTLDFVKVSLRLHCVIQLNVREYYYYYFLKRG